MTLLHLYRYPGLTEAKTHALLTLARQRVSQDLQGIDTEFCFNVETTGTLTDAEHCTLNWLLAETFVPTGFGDRSSLGEGQVLEVGPRMNFTTAWSTNAVSICHACGLTKVRRIERSRRFRLNSADRLNPQQLEALLALVHDRMTECLYPEPLDTFETGIQPEAMFPVPVLAGGRAALERINREMGLAFDEWDLDYYTDLFAKRIGRDPTNVECFDIAQSNSEHSRH